ncbi:hypothetical protein XPN_4232 [Xanthomonas arboricola pv. pruni MAFF 301427]|nr:hypothetical protein XPN_4232 [Xanthomonas arboricola pv. pruni MAFF 301427]
MLAQAATPAVTIQQQARRDDISVRRRPEIDCMMANPVPMDCAGFDGALCKQMRQWKRMLLEFLI